MAQSCAGGREELGGRLGTDRDTPPSLAGAVTRPGVPGSGGHRRVTRRRGRAGVLRWAAATAAVFLLAIAGLTGTAHAVGTAHAASFGSGSASGYILNGGGPYWSVHAVFTVPLGICSPGENGPGTLYWVTLQGAGELVQAGIGLGCAGGKPQYDAWHVKPNLAGGALPIAQPVQPGDRVAARVICRGSACLEHLNDETKHWTANFPMQLPAGYTANLAAVGAESYNGGMPSGHVQVTGARVNFLPISHFDPSAWQEPPGLYGGTAALDPSPLDLRGEDFYFYWNGNPGS